MLLGHGEPAATWPRATVDAAKQWAWSPLREQRVADTEWMCYVVLLGTDADDDLSQHDAGDVRFTRSSPDEFGDGLLQLPHHWVINVGTCGCGFRHLASPSVDFGFSEPVDWWPESDEDLTATKQVIRVIRALVTGGALVECVDLWNGSIAENPTTLEVHLGTVPDATLRFFENHRFVFKGD